MMREAFLAVALSLLFVAVAQSTSLIRVPVPELVVRSDAVVAATIIEQSNNADTIAISQTLFGTAPHVITIPGVYDKGIEGIFFLVRDQDQWKLVYPAALEPPTKLDHVRSLTDMRTSPRKYFTDPQLASSPDFLEMLGYLLRDKDEVDGISREAAVDHLRAALGSANTMAVLQAMGALRTLDCKDAKAVIPLMQHPDREVHLAAMRYVGWTRDRVAVAPLCKLLDELKGWNSPEAGEIGSALGNIGDRSAVPALEAAIKRGVFGGATDGLTRLGNEGSFAVLLEVFTTRESLNSLDAIMDILRRSNKPVEPWMKEPQWEPVVGLTHKQDWTNWWQQNKLDFKILKTYEEAYGPR